MSSEIKLLRPAVKKDLDNSFSRIRAIVVSHFLVGCLEIGKELSHIKSVLSSYNYKFVDYCMANLEGFSHTTINNYVKVWETFGNNKYEMIAKKVQWSVLCMLTQKKYHKELDRILIVVKDHNGKLLNAKDLGLVIDPIPTTKKIKKMVGYKNADFDLSKIYAEVTKGGVIFISDKKDNLILRIDTKGKTIAFESKYLTPVLNTSQGEVKAEDVEQMIKDLNHYRKLLEELKMATGINLKRGEHNENRERRTAYHQSGR